MVGLISLPVQFLLQEQEILRSVQEEGGKVGDIKKWNGRVKWAAYLDCSKSRKDLEDRFNSSCTGSR